MTSSRVTRWSGAILYAVVAIFLLGSVGTGYAQLNLVYVETNDGVAHANSVAAYSNDGSGNLTPLAGSPYLTGGTGVGGNGAGQDGALDADQEVIINSAGNLLLAVNGHSNTVASFTINSDGTLTAVAGSPFTASGRDPVSLGLFDNYLPGGLSLLTVVDKDGDPNQSGGTPRYVNYEMTSGGVMTPMGPGTSIAMPAGSDLSQALTDEALGLEFTDEFMATPSTITARKVLKSGKMHTVSSVPSPDGLLLLGEVKHPTQNIIYVAMPGSNGMAVLTFDSTGNLTLANTVANAGNTICWFDTNAAGTYLYSGNAGDGTVSVFDISDPTSPVETQYFKLSGNARTANVRVDPTGQFLYAMDVTHLHVLNISAVDGTLSETVPVVNLPTPKGYSALGIATLELPAAK
jgi:6-phosphogluconolactonase (cycloisomerase 2 family)